MGTLGDTHPSTTKRGGGVRVHPGTLGRALDPRGLIHGPVTAPRVPAAALSAPGGRGGERRLLPRRLCGDSAGARVGVAAPAWEATRCSGLHPAQARRFGEEVVSSLPFPRGAQTWGALRGALHRVRERRLVGDTGRSTWRTTLTTHRVCASFPHTFPPYTTPLKKTFLFNPGKSRAFPSLASPTCAARPLLSGASPGERTLICHLTG